MAEEVHLADTVHKEKAHYMAVRPRDVMCHAEEIFWRDPERWSMSANESVTRGWFKCFAARNGLKMVSKKYLEAVGLQWTSAWN